MQTANWNCIWKKDHIDILHFNDGTNFKQIGIYNVITENICKKCGNPYMLKIGGGDPVCLESYLHEKLIFADGIFQVGHYYNKGAIQTKAADDLMNEHIWKLKKDVEYAIPLAKAMFLTIQNNFPILLQANAIIPMPNFIESLYPEVKAVGLAKEIQKLFKTNGRNIEVINALQKIKNIKVRELHSREEREEAVKDMYRFDVNTDVKGKTVLLIDDVLTAGNNKGECIKILRENKAKQIWVLVAGRNK